MNKILGTALAAAALTFTATSAIADEMISETRAIDARIVKVKLDGVIDLTVKQGATPSLTLYGEQRHLDKVTTSLNGDTLRIDNDASSWTFGGKKRQVRAELTLPNLNEFTSEGVGATEVTGFTGEQITLALDGAGSVKVTGNFKNINSRMGGVGSMTLNAGNSELVDLNMRGAGSITVNGQSRLLRARMGGVGSLDAKGLQSDTVDLDLTGLGGATVYAKNAAHLRLSGLGSATVYGQPPNRNATARGMGSVSWK
ncbi:GIN domain-containing protein [Massilia cavernae]|uniref:DUF2807 domain-containing protein n=1 Tax=Massilia cavernae TaxID=2320864 RepID=A0A418Y728_9BURK|nr:DUF2807 domain-containing protein [Massilia cavernae]RJG25021.1 DUF2807 domain-containing protein [Massilia cavernae]